eukprot:6212099-Pleurochrysis_carterae.AAC.1
MAKRGGSVAVRGGADEVGCPGTTVCGCEQKVVPEGGAEAAAGRAHTHGAPTRVTDEETVGACSGQQRGGGFDGCGAERAHAHRASVTASVCTHPSTCAR